MLVNTLCYECNNYNIKNFLLSILQLVKQYEKQIVHSHC